jgi:hypothetical protein
MKVVLFSTPQNNYIYKLIKLHNIKRLDFFVWWKANTLNYDRKQRMNMSFDYDLFVRDFRSRNYSNEEIDFIVESYLNCK